MTMDMVRTGQRESLPQITQDEILRYLNLNPNDVKTQALIATCERYGFDPLLKHVVLITGNMYVTRDGLMHVAHDSGKFDGLEVDQVADSETHFIAVASVWRKDMGRPFRFQGRYPKSGQMAKYGPEMAEKVAVCRALRHAFDVSLCSREETWEEEREVAQNDPPAPRRRVENSPETELSRAILAFARDARNVGIDVMGESDTSKPSKSKLEKTLADIAAFAGASWQFNDPAHWVAAGATLEAYAAHLEQQEQEAVEADEAEFTEETEVPTALFGADEARTEPTKPNTNAMVGGM